MATRNVVRSAFVLGLTAGLLSCGDKASPSPPVESTTITITNAGVSPKNVIIALGQRVLFINNASGPRYITSDPHPSHDDCPEIDQVGFLTPGQSRETGNMVVARTCGFHDHDMPTVSSLWGSITAR